LPLPPAACFWACPPHPAATAVTASRIATQVAAADDLFEGLQSMVRI